MAEEERILLGNVLDGLDRILDDESKAIDIYALIFATSKAVSGTEHFDVLNKAANDLERVIRAAFSAADERLEALKVTDDLRKHLARTLD